MSMVGTEYDATYPRIMVISLDPPNGATSPFITASQRTTEYIASYHERENYTIHRPNVHWAMTQIIVKDLLVLFGLEEENGVAVVPDSYAGRPIQNVSAKFAHVNMAKCSMNTPNGRQAHQTVHELCSVFLAGEIRILSPDILITQGKRVNEYFNHMLDDFYNDLAIPVVHSGKIFGVDTVWIPMPHPARNLQKIRSNWQVIIHAIKDVFQIY